MPARQLFIIALGILLVLAIWMIGGISFQYSCPPFAGIFGSNSNLENTFAPVGAFFSAIASFGALYAIYMQFKTFKEQQLVNNFLVMLQTHRANRDSLTIQIIIDDKSEQNITMQHSGVDCFEKLFLQYNQIAIYAGIAGETRNNKIYFPDTLEQLCTTRFDPLRGEDGSINRTSDEKLILVEEIFDEYTHYKTSHYFWHLYHTLKYINMNFKASKKQFISSLRSQLSTYEMLLLYYHGLANTDYIEPCDRKISKYRRLIEETSFLHGIKSDLKFSDSSLTEYDKVAFNPPCS